VSAISAAIEGAGPFPPSPSGAMVKLDPLKVRCTFRGSSAPRYPLAVLEAAGAAATR